MNLSSNKRYRYYLVTHWHSLGNHHGHKFILNKDSLYIIAIGMDPTQNQSIQFHLPT